MNLDHLVYAVPDLQQAIDDLSDILGIRPAIGGNHAAWGTWNALLSLGPGTYLEIVAHDPAASMKKPVFGLEKLTHPKLIRWAAKSSDLQNTVAVAKDIGINLSPVSKGQRAKPDGQLLEWQLSDPMTVPREGLIPFFIDWGNSPHPSGATPQGCRVQSFYGEHPQANIIAHELSRLDCPITVSPAQKPRLIARIECPKGMAQLDDTGIKIIDPNA